MAKYKIQTPNRHFNGIRFGLAFSNGQAVTEDDALALKMEKELGYEVHKLKESKAKNGDKTSAASKANATEKTTPTNKG